jgi:hypothetical protein
MRRTVHVAPLGNVIFWRDLIMNLWNRGRESSPA